MNRTGTFLHPAQLLSFDTRLDYNACHCCCYCYYFCRILNSIVSWIDFSVSTLYTHGDYKRIQSTGHNCDRLTKTIHKIYVRTQLASVYELRNGVHDEKIMMHLT